MVAEEHDMKIIVKKARVMQVSRNTGSLVNVLSRLNHFHKCANSGILETQDGRSENEGENKIAFSMRRLL